MFRLVIMAYCLLAAVIVDCSSEFSAGQLTLLLLTKGDLINVCVLQALFSVSIEYEREQMGWAETFICLFIYLLNSVSFFVFAFSVCGVEHVIESILMLRFSNSVWLSTKSLYSPSVLQIGYLGLYT